jgi:LuxR family maltose regulon positive regulatory protein
MIDIRADDLRFSPQEMSTFLNQVMGLALSGDQVATLETRTEGWIAGLQLAALSMRGQEDAAGFISAFTGDDRYISDYLVDEVLTQQSKDTKDFLLQTSILDRMTGPLCDIVTNREGSQNVLEKLEQANLFIVPLDNRRLWYRYHHLFADLLRQRLEESTPLEEIKSLHRLASQWYEENDFLIEAVEHGLAAEDYEDMIRLIGEGATELFTRSQMNFLLKWQARLPRELVASRPRLCMVFIWAWVATGHPEEAEHCLQTIEQTLGAGMDDLFTEGGAETMDPAIWGALAEVAVVRAQLAIGRGDITGALKLTRLVLPYLKDDEGPYLHNTPKESRMVVSFIMGLVQKSSGDLSAAEKTLSNAAALGQEQGNVQIVAVASGHLASVQATQGRLRRAVQTWQCGLQLVQEMAGRRSPLSGLLQAELGNLLFEQNDLEAALHHLREGIAVAKPWSYWDTLVLGYTGLARVKAAQGDIGGAFAALDELAALGQNNPQTVMPAVESFRAKLWAVQGEVDRARRWAERTGLDADSEIDVFREGELVILAHVLMAQKEWDKATSLISRLLDATEAGKRWRCVIELLALQALILDAQGKQDEALEVLARALTLAEPEGYVRTFVDESEPMAALLRRAASRGIAPGYTPKLLAAFEPDTISGKPPAATTLIEPLSERELEVLRLLKTELSGPEIARELTIALPTLRFHTRNIYGKLGVHNRIQAVTRAETLGLL